MRQWRRQHFHAMRTEAAPAFARFPPDSCDSRDRSAEFCHRARPCRRLQFFPAAEFVPTSECRAAAEFDMALRFRNAIRLAGMKANESVVGSQRRIVGVDGIERKVGSSRQMEHFRAGGFKLAAKFVMLRLRDREIRRMKEIPAPASGRRWMAGPIPPRAASTPVLAPERPTMEWPLKPWPLTAGFCNSAELFKDCDRLPVLQSKQVLWQKQSGKALPWRNRTNVMEVEGNQYFPPDAIKAEYFKPSATHTVCPWKGTASYYDVEVGGKKQPRCGLVLSRAQAGGEADQGICGVLEGRKGARSSRMTAELCSA